MAKSVYFINDSPRSAVSLSGQMNEDFSVGQVITLVNRLTLEWCKKIVQRVVDSDDGNCVLDLYY